MQEAEEFICIFVPISELIILNPLKKTPSINKGTEFLHVPENAHVHAQRSSPFLPCLPKEVQRSKCIRTHGPHLASGLCGAEQWGTVQGGQGKGGPKCSFWLTSSTYII